MTISVRTADDGDLHEVAAIYEHYVLTSAKTFDLTAPTVDDWRVKHRREVLEGPYHLLVADHAGRVVGWCETGRFRDRRAYDTSCTVSIYCAPDSLGRGVGSALYSTLFATLADGPFHRAYAGITQPNEASVALHERFGFVRCGLYREVGRKHDRWWDVAWYEKDLS